MLMIMMIMVLLLSAPFLPLPLLRPPPQVRRFMCRRKLLDGTLNLLPSLPPPLPAATTGGPPSIIVASHPDNVGTTPGSTASSGPSGASVQHHGAAAVLCILQGVEPGSDDAADALVAAERQLAAWPRALRLRELERRVLGAVRACGLPWVGPTDNLFQARRSASRPSCFCFFPATNYYARQPLVWHFVFC